MRTRMKKKWIKRRTGKKGRTKKKNYRKGIQSDLLSTFHSENMCLRRDLNFSLIREKKREIEKKTNLLSRLVSNVFCDC